MYDDFDFNDDFSGGSSKNSFSGDYGYNHSSTSTVSSRHKWLAILLNLFFGSFGIHRFYLGRTGSGAAMLIMTVLGGIIPYVGIVLLAIVGIWNIVDLFRLIFGGLTDVDCKKLM